MARVPDTSGAGEVAERIRARRGGFLRPIDRVLLHSPRVADGWNGLLGTLRGGTTLPADLREIVVLRIAVLNEASYEWDSHEKDALAVGITPEQMAVLRLETAATDPALDADQQLVVSLTDTMTQEIAVPDALFDRVSERFGSEQLVELVTTVAAYNMVSRLVVALDVKAPAAEVVA